MGNSCIPAFEPSSSLQYLRSWKFEKDELNLYTTGIFKRLFQSKTTTKLLSFFSSNYMIYTEGNSLFHFLHSDSVVPLGLSPSIVPRKQYITAEVVDKEYCQARKPENRFKVPQGTKFYRVRCKPLAKESTSSSDKNSPTSTNGNEKCADQ